VTQVFFGNKVIIQIFRGLDWLSGISGAEIVTQKPKIGCKFKSHKRQPWSFWLKATTHQPIRARELFKPSKDQENLVVYNEKQFFSFGFGVFGQ